LCKELTRCPVCRKNHCINYILDVRLWFCKNCDTHFDEHQVIHVYDEMGDLVEVIAASQPDIWNYINKRDWKKKKGLIQTITL